MDSEKQIPLTNEELKTAMREALNDMPVTIWNGQEHPIDVPFGKSITYITKDIRDVKGTLNEHTNLLSGIKERKRIMRSTYEIIISIEELIRNSLLWKIFLIVVLAVSSLYGFMKGVEKIFELNLLK